MPQPLTNKSYLLEKFPGKGGWTYAAIPEALQDKHAPFGWLRVRGSIDSYELKGYRLMAMGNGQLFLPVKAEIRKKIGKKEGDWVHIILYPDYPPQEVLEELLLCLEDEPAARTAFLSYTDDERKAFADWIYAAKTEEARIARIVKAIEKLLNNQKLSRK